MPGTPPIIGSAREHGTRVAGVMPAPPETPPREKRSRAGRDLAVGLAFLSPNILGFLVFTAIPLLMSLVFAFTNWNLREHNPNKNGAIRFVGFDNFIQLFEHPNFLQYLGNTFFLMMGMPFGIAASLASAILLSKDLRGGGLRVWTVLLSCAGVIVAISLLSAVGMGTTGMTLLLIGLASAIILSGVAGGQTIYRTLFYVPHFTAGVATFLLWKKLYNPSTGPINQMLEAPLRRVSDLALQAPAWVAPGGVWIATALAIMLMMFGFRRLYVSHRDGDLGAAAAIVPLVLLILPASLLWFWWTPESAPPLQWAKYLFSASAVIGVIGLGLLLTRDQEIPCRPSDGLGGALMLSGLLMTGQLVLIGLGTAFFSLPAFAAQPGGLEPPNWLSEVNWAKPAIMIMGFWGAVGSNTMLLYLAALTNVPADLYEAADIDGASRFQKFWNVTWPQLAPTTFFVVVMGVIGGLQGGFEMARVMTNGGPAGATTTLAYFIYTEGFEVLRLGFASAVAWTMFLLVLIITLFNWRFGNRYVND